ncbi:MAG: DnaJ domain-containing protein, partial [Rhodospirillales bacterium]
DGGARSDGRMDRAAAARILGVAPDAEREEVLRAWRDLMKLNHPDQGGSAYLAARINEAKETLLG